jgi:hypothetical protein
MPLEIQELFCHNCQKYVRFNLDLSRNGNYRLDCPSCGHDHYRTVRNRQITDRRWGQSQLQQISTIGAYSVSFYASASTGSNYLAVSWANTTAGNAW